MPTTDLITDVDLATAVAAFPTWLAVEVTDWVRGAEQRGDRFPSTMEAVRRALEVQVHDGSATR